jgi:hypothetical protein
LSGESFAALTPHGSALNPKVSLLRSKDPTFQPQLRGYGTSVYAIGWWCPDKAFPDR